MPLFQSEPASFTTLGCKDIASTLLSKDDWMKEQSSKRMDGMFVAETPEFCQSEQNLNRLAEHRDNFLGLF